LIYDKGQTFEFGLMKITLTVFLKSDFVLLSARGDALRMCKSVLLLVTRAAAGSRVANLSNGHKIMHIYQD